MLNGVDPLLVIVLKVKPPEDKTAPPLPGILNKFLDMVGIPIPIYLSERGINRRIPGAQVLVGSQNSGIIVESESRSIDIQTKVEAVTDKDPLKAGQTADPEVTQRPIDTQLSINLIASRDSILITALLALMDMLISRLESQEYSIHYINRSTVIFGARLSRFATSMNPNEDKIQIDLTLSVATKEVAAGVAAKASQSVTPVANTSTTSLSVHP